MKATGVVRRLDDLGRLVIPKEIRKIYNLQEGDSIEFFVNETKEIILRKFQHFEDKNTQINQMIRVYQSMFKQPLLFYGDDKLLMEDSVNSRQLTNEAKEKFKIYHENLISSVMLFEEDKTYSTVYVFPVVIDSYWTGSFIMIQDINNESMKAVVKSFIKLIIESKD